MKTEEVENNGSDKNSDKWPKVLYRTETVEVWPHFTNSNYYHVRFKDTGVFYAEKAYLERQFQWNGNLDFSHALRAMKDGKKVRMRNVPQAIYYIKSSDKDYIMYNWLEKGEHYAYEFCTEALLSNDWEIVE